MLVTLHETKMVGRSDQFLTARSYRSYWPET